ncbi:transcriptional regulator [Bacillus aquiflavi]|nr:transcriptional regulator [Bacillus aquiflavi]
MEIPISIIQTKLLVPNVKENWIHRSKLTKKMKSIPKFPLTILHSGAGYGKSTALALFAKGIKMNCYWYSISPSDDEILPFLTYMITAMKHKEPEFGKSLLQYINGMDRFIHDDELGLLCSLFINEILSVNKEIILILDDFHQIEHSHTINVWIEKLLEHLPENLHLVISSRSRPKWKRLIKMKASGQLLEITERDLILTFEETELLLTNFDEIEINREAIKQIYRRTEGWIIAITMIAQQIMDYEEFPQTIDQFPLPLYDLFQYLAMEVFLKQSPPVQQLLLQTSIFDELTPEICKNILDLENSLTMLKNLAERNLFIHKIGEDQYRYHALFKEFLEKQFQKKDPEAYEELHKKSARFFEGRGLWEIALIYYEKIGFSKAVATILHHYGTLMLENGKLESLDEKLACVTATDQDNYYQLWFLKGEILRYRSLYKEAEECYNKTIYFAHLKQDLLSKSNALEGKARIYLDTTQPHIAERLLSEAIATREKLSKKENIARLYRLQAENLINSGKTTKAEKWIKRGKALNLSIENGNLQARLYLRTGRLLEAKKILNKNKINEQHKLLLPQSHRETELLLSLIEVLTGNGTEAKQLAQAGIQHGISIQSPYVEACGWIRLGHSVQLVDEYDSLLAKNCYETALQMMDKLRVARGKAEPLMGLCLLYGANGQYERAIEVGEQGLIETEKAKDIWLSALITLSIGLASVYHFYYDKALVSIHKAEEYFDQCNDIFGKMYCSLWKAYIYHEMSHEEQFEKNMDLFLKLVQLNHNEYIFYKRTMFGPQDLQMFIPLLIEGQKRNINRHFTTKILRDMGLVGLQTHPGFTLQIQTLGQFRVYLGKKEIKNRDWLRGKAKELFQLFITKRNHFLQKEEIFQLLWPDQDEKSAGRDFKVALNALNNALEPKRKARVAPFFIIREGTAYGLNPNASFELDAVIFEQWILTGLEEKDDEKARRFLQRGLHYYKGDY